VTEPKANLPASIRQRLKNLSRKQSVPFQEILQRYAIERFLFRLSQSEHAGKFVLKGAQMLVAWGSPRTRPTMDIDLLGYTKNDLANLESVVRNVCDASHAQPDGITFDPTTVKAVRIKEDADYEGVRVTFLGTLDAARVPMQIDIGFNDTVTPAPETVTYPSLLGMQVPELRGYNRDTLIAEKVEAMIKLGEINSRMKDFFDIWALSRSFPFTLKTLASAIDATCRRRGTPVTGLPAILLPDSSATADKQIQWSAFLRKSRLENTPADFHEVAAAIAEFIGPPISALLVTAPPPVTSWTAPGPWR
jgi:hypothetical protein